MLNTVPRANVRRAASSTLGLALLWVLVAAWRPDVTYHLAPLLIAAVPPVMITLDNPDRIETGSVIVAGLGGLVLGLGIAALLSSFGWLSGPSLLPAGGAAAEAVVFSFLGAIAGSVVGFVRTKR